ncbi:HET-domain-containing protein [Pleurostoma richardsiae]|uniref:HET-domain-containing protein n=1 Tax=Pleurostoma richardsiae TaxID=41990 RepID=A0AA38R1P9_9PEZI|nr:HET-domain-containing protein [Pleurostoma richardsiae]
MRLLYRNDTGTISRTNDLLRDVPRYAILSHTWGAEEVTFNDLIDGTGLNKRGYDKIRFCEEQASRDGLSYFWVDTCCIDKSNNTELTEAINSMFRWYSNAARCYVYLADVSHPAPAFQSTSVGAPWESAFRDSRWFTRGWTLQELLAPASVEFFSREGVRLGDKGSLEQHISDVAHIPAEVLRGSPLSGFGVPECLAWMQHRETSREEDKAYALLGLLDVSMPLVYGEGRDKALKRLLGEVHKTTKIEALPVPIAAGAAFDSHANEHDARCHPRTRVTLLEEVMRWADDPQGEPIFWLNGMAGTGKSTISRTVAQSFAETGDLGGSFFFKRGERDRGNAALFFTTIAAQLVAREPSLALDVRAAIDSHPGLSTKALKEQFERLLLEPLGNLKVLPNSRKKIILVVDALDECDREDDIRVIIHLLSRLKALNSLQVKAFVTGRPELWIRLDFKNIEGRYQDLVLHDISKPVIELDIAVYLQDELANIREGYNKSVAVERQLVHDWPGQATIKVLVDMAVPLFIFAATVCRFLKDRRCGGPDQQLTKILKHQTRSQGSKLDTTYLPILEQLIVGLAGSEKQDVTDIFRKIVGSIVLLAEPLSTLSLANLISVSRAVVDDMMDLLHSVLSVPSKSTSPVRLFHLSFRDFLVDPGKRDTNPFWVDETATHSSIAASCLDLLSSSGHLKKDICNLQVPGITRANVDLARVESCLPTHVRSLRVLVGPTMNVGVIAFLDDANRFLLNFRSIIDQCPLQVYASAIVFAPKRSVVRCLFEKYTSNWISLLPKVSLEWNSCRQTLECHGDNIKAVAFARDGKTVASGSYDGTIRLWDATTGEERQALEGHKGVNAIAFSQDSKTVLLGSDDDTVQSWDTTTGEEMQVLRGPDHYVYAVAISHDTQTVATISLKIIRVWDVMTGEQRQALEVLSWPFSSIAFSQDDQTVAVGSFEQVVVWDIVAGKVRQVLEIHRLGYIAIAFSQNDKMMACGSDSSVLLCDVRKGEEMKVSTGRFEGVSAVNFSEDGKTIVSASFNGTVRLWDPITGENVQQESLII